jgi:hypothetical protein
MPLRACLIVFLAAACFTIPALASIYIVDPDGLGDFPTIQDAVNAATDGDIIELTDGVFTGAGNRDIDYLGKTIAVRSQSGDPQACIIDCQGTESDPHRGFHFHSAEQAGSVLEGVTVAHGWAPGMPHAGGGAILCEEQSSPTVVSCRFFKNRESAVFCRGGSAITFADCVFLRNDGWSGGAIYFVEASPVITHCDFIENDAEYTSGALRGHASTIEITHCTFAQNRAPGSAAIGLIYGCTGRVLNCLFEGNVAFHTGGCSAVNLHGFCTVTLDGCTFAGNNAGMGGSIVESTKMSHVRYANCTFWGNSVPNGRVLHCGELDAVLSNTIIAFSPQGQAVYCESDDVVLTCCDIYGNAGGDWVGYIADQFEVNGNFSKDPLFCDPENGNLHLGEGSPCAPFSPPNEECDLIGAWPVGCEPVSVGDGQAAAAGMHLAPSAPNPFEPSTRITYTIPTGVHATPVLLRVYDLEGRLVKTLVETPQSAGIHTVTWDATNESGTPVAGGLYFCRLKITGEVQTRRMIVMR